MVEYLGIYVFSFFNNFKIIRARKQKTTGSIVNILVENSLAFIQVVTRRVSFFVVARKVARLGCHNDRRGPYAEPRQGAARR